MCPISTHYFNKKQSIIELAVSLILSITSTTVFKAVSYPKVTSPKYIVINSSGIPITGKSNSALKPYL
jgi:hypothetical protein